MAKTDEDDMNPGIRLVAPAPRLDQGSESQGTWKETADPESTTKTEKPDIAPLNPLAHRPHPTPLSRRDNIYRGSYQKSLRSPQSSRAASHLGTHPNSSRQSLSQTRLENLLVGVDTKLDTFDIDELRDGFFDAMFLRPTKQDKEAMYLRAVESLPSSFQRQSGLRLITEEWGALIAAAKEVSTTRSGIKLLKSFIGVFLAYVICLIPGSRDWLGRYSYILVVSAIVNHPGRSIGSQIDGAILTSIGISIGLAWGSLALFVSTSTGPAQGGYGGIVATFLVIFTLSISWLRSALIHFYQGVIGAGIAIFYTCLANTSGGLQAEKPSRFAIPWLLGQVLCLVVASLVFPSAGSRPLAISFHSCLETIEARLMFYDLLHQSAIKRKLAWHFVNLSTAVRDFTIELTISRYHPEDVRTLRNLLQGAIRGVLTMRPPPSILQPAPALNSPGEALDPATSYDTELCEPSEPVEVVRLALEIPCRNLQLALQDAIHRVDAVLMDLSGHRKYLGPSMTISSDLAEIMITVKQEMRHFDSVDDSLVAELNMPDMHSENSEMVEILLFAHCLRQAADKIIQLLEHCASMQQRESCLQVNLPSYGLKKSLVRTNAQVRHDRGGLTAAVYFHSKAQLDKTLRELQGREYVPQGYQDHPRDSSDEHAHVQDSGPSDAESHVPSPHEPGKKHATLRYRLWEVLHRLQGFESRFALKMTLVTGLCSIPAWRSVSQEWWSRDESWWAVVTIWMLMHPRIGGNVQDLFIRASCAILGAIWGGISFAAGNGDPYIMAVLGAVFLIPMLYRFTQSNHPRSGIIGCVSFAVVSLAIVTNHQQDSTVYIAWTRGSAFVAGIVAAVLVNWVLWPFIARHELRKSISAMLLHSAILYRGTIARYVYYTEGNKPGSEDIARSEMLEGKLREGFVRVRQLMELTKHEIRLRAPFNPLPYSALIQSLEAFFEHLIQVRQSSLYFQPHMLPGTEKGADDLLTLRRDAVATILMNLYTLAGALRSDRPVPRYLPSAATARQRFLEKMAEFEGDEKNASQGLPTRPEEERRWAEVYYEAYTAALTDIVEELQVLEYFTKEICGEVGFDIDL